MTTLPDLEAWEIVAWPAETGSFAASTIQRHRVQGGRSVGATARHRPAEPHLAPGRADRHRRRVGRPCGPATGGGRCPGPHGGITWPGPHRGADTSFGQRQVAPLLPEPLRHCPALLIDLHLDDRLIDVIGGGFDFALRIAPLQRSSLRSRWTCDLQGLPCSSYAYQSIPKRWLFSHRSGEQASVAVTGPLQINNGEAAMPPSGRAGPRGAAGPVAAG